MAVNETMDGDFVFAKGQGSAFPSSVAVGPTGDVHQGQFFGLTKREWFAAHVEQPGVEELAIAGGRPDLAGEHDRVEFYEWWRSLSLDSRFKIWAKVRYLMADAMIAAGRGAE